MGFWTGKSIFTKAGPLESWSGKGEGNSIGISGKGSSLRRSTMVITGGEADTRGAVPVVCMQYVAGVRLLGEGCWRGRGPDAGSDVCAERLCHSELVDWVFCCLKRARQFLHTRFLLTTLMFSGAQRVGHDFSSLSDAYSYLNLNLMPTQP